LFPFYHLFLISFLPFASLRIAYYNRVFLLLRPYNISITAERVFTNMWYWTTLREHVCTFPFWLNSDRHVRTSQHTSSPTITKHGILALTALKRSFLTAALRRDWNCVLHCCRHSTLVTACCTAVDTVL
jgi:hypothetical protein